MTEKHLSPSSLPESSKEPSKDYLMQSLEIKYFCAPDEGGRQKALTLLEKDRLRAVMAGMTPEQRQFWAGVDEVPWDKVKKGGQAAAEVVLPALVGFKFAEYLSPEAGKNLAVAAMAGSVTMEALALGMYKAEKVAKKHPRAAVLAQTLTLSRLFLSHGGTALGSFGLGLGGAEIRDAIGRLQGIEQIVSPAAAGGGEGFGDQPPVAQPVPEAAPGNVLPHLGGEIPAEDLGQLPKLPEVDVQKIVDSLPKHVGVAQLPENQQLGASHWRLAEAWSRPLANTFGLSDSAKTFFTDAVKDLTQDQGGIRMDTIVNYDKRQIGDYLAEAVARLKETDPTGWKVKVPEGDLDRLTKIAEFLKNSK